MRRASNQAGYHFLRGGSGAPGFTLVEILIVVVIIAILAAIAVPKLSSAAQLSRQNSIKDDLQYIRTEIAVYASQHGDAYPGGGSSGSATLFAQQMTGYTDASGDVQSQGQPTPPYNFGPYLTGIPKNPINGSSAVKIDSGTGVPTPDNSYGWIYQPVTGRIYPDVPGLDSTGEAFVNY